MEHASFIQVHLTWPRPFLEVRACFECGWVVAPWIFLGNPLPGWLLQAQAEGGGAGAKEGALPSIVGSNRAREERDSEAGQQQHSHQLAGQGKLWLAQRQRWCVGGCACLTHA